MDDRGAPSHAFFEPKTTGAAAGALEQTSAYHATSSNERTAANAIARPYQLTTTDKRTTTHKVAKCGPRWRPTLTLLENNRALLIVFAGKLAGYVGEWPPAAPFAGWFKGDFQWGQR